jgi:predicted Holliday junction resolvase-like endonuclease
VRTPDDLNGWTWWATKIVAVLVLLWVVFGLVRPQLRLYGQRVERQAQIADAKARAEAAEHLAEAEVARANGVAEANTIIAGSITDEYTRWLYVSNLDQTPADVIYVATEAGIPITEAGRFTGSATE